MLIKNEVRCSLCPKSFCCLNCCSTHIKTKHRVELQNSQNNCNICSGQPIFLKQNISEQLVEHLVEKHSPLCCHNCDKIFTSKEQLSGTISCTKNKMNNIIMEENVEDTNKENTNSDKTDLPGIEKLLADGKINEEMLTPLTKINLKWRRKSAGLQISISDHSGFDSSRRSEMSFKGNIRRTTSTPMGLNNEVLSKPTPFESLCSTFPSSIEEINVTDRSSITASRNITPSPIINNVPRQNSTFRTHRQRLPVSQTPLRQVLSKSLQKALQQNGRMIPVQRKIAFSSMSSTSSESDTTCAPLDLRTTPALKRSNSMPTVAKTTPMNLKIIPVYKSVEEGQNLDQFIEENKLNEAHQESSFSKYLSCQRETTFSHITPEKKILQDTDIWHTPLPIEDEKEVVEKPDETKTKPKGRILDENLKGSSNAEPKITGIFKKFFWLSDDSKQETTSILYKAASFAGLIRTKSSPVKNRKRPRLSSFTSPPSALKSPLAKKYKTIHGRRPIRRMQTD